MRFRRSALHTLSLIALPLALTACGNRELSAASLPAPKAGAILVYAGGSTTKDAKPTGKGLDVADDTNPPPGARHGTEYHNGSIVGALADAYYICYGGWTSADMGILLDLATSIGSTSYFQIASLCIPTVSRAEAALRRR